MAKREANTQATRITRAVNAEANRDAKPSSIEELKSVLHEHRMSATPGRLAILGFFQNDLSHPDVESVQAAVTGQNPGISKTTVYRILEEFAQHGLIRPFSTDGRRKRYDGNTKPHHHLICTDCGRVEALMHDVTPKY